MLKYILEIGQNIIFVSNFNFLVKYRPRRSDHFKPYIDICII